MLSVMRRLLQPVAPTIGVTLSLLVAAIVFASHAAHAQVIVISSSAPTLKSGQVLQNTNRITIPDGSTVVFVLPSGASRTVSGPFNGKASELTRGVRTDTALFNAVKKYVRTGGSNTGTVGALRSAAPHLASTGTAKFSWHDIPITAQGDICVEKGAELALIRATKGAAQSVTVVNMNSTNRAKTHFIAGETRAPWPNDLTPENGSFAILIARQPMRQIRMRLVAPLPAPEDTLRVLHGQRCQLQFQAYLRGLLRVATNNK